MGDGRFNLRWVSERHLRIGLGDEATATTQRAVWAACGRLRAMNAGVVGILDLTPAYTSVLAEFDPLTVDVSAVEDAVGRALEGLEVTEDGPGRVVEIPVCYEGVCGPDLEEMARLVGLAPGEIAARHSGATYRVNFIGFAPGFAYLSGLPEELSVARLDVPRTAVPAGSVGIAGGQTGVYPRATPGGWRLIGRTPVVMFDASREKPSMLEMGDEVRFVPMALAAFEAAMAARAEQCGCGAGWCGGCAVAAGGQSAGGKCGWRGGVGDDGDGRRDGV